MASNPSPAPQHDGLQVICAGGFRAAMEAIVPRFEAATGRRVALTFGTPAKTRELVSAGTGFDAVVVTVVSVNPEAAAQLLADPQFIVAKSPVGMGFSAAAGQHEVGTIEAFRAAVRAIDKLGLSDPKAGTNLGADVLAAAERLGFADDLKSRAHFIMGPGSMVSAEVAKGHLDAVITLASEIVTVPGVVYGGPIPAEMGLGTPFLAGIGKQATDPAGARSLLTFLQTAEAKQMMRNTALLVEED
jgi:molybdate transport system substrate-binding protein